MRVRHRFRYPWRNQNQVRLLRDSQQFFPAMLKAIDHAKRFVCVEMYLFESGRTANSFIDHFVAALERGVRVFLLLDDFGCRKLHRYDRDRLQKAGVCIVYYNPVRYGQLRRSLFRDHRKLFIVDERIAFIGGAGITDEFNANVDHRHFWRETMVQVEGECVLDWIDLFTANWAQHSAEMLPASELPSAYKFEKPVLARAVCTRGGEQEIMRSFYNRVRGAEHRVWIAIAYFVPSRKLRRELRRRAEQGVDVRLMLPGPYTDHPAVRHAGRRFYTRLMKSGVQIWEYQPRFLHQKVVLCDQWASIGSSNIDRWNLRWNLEANQEIDDESFSRQVKIMFEEDFRHSNQIDLELWKKRPFSKRLLEWFWGHIDIWLLRITGRGREFRN